MPEFQDPKLATPQACSVSLSPNALEHSWRNGNTTITLRNSQGGLGRFIPTSNHALDVNRNLYDEAPSSVCIILCNSQDEWRTHAKEYEHLEFAWGVALDDGTLVVKTAECAGIEFERFERVVTHEMNHGFWLINFGLRGAGWCPIWIVEGLANLAAPARELITPAQEIARLVREKGLSSGALEYHYRDMPNPNELVFYYSLWRSLVQELCQDRNIIPLMRCIRRFLDDPSEERFERAFQEQFGCGQEAWLRKFIVKNAI